MTGKLVSRRQFLQGLGLVLAAPAIVRASSLMPMTFRPLPLLLNDIYVDLANLHVGDGSRLNPYHNLEYAIQHLSIEPWRGTRVNIRAGTIGLSADFTNLRDVIERKGIIASKDSPLIFQGYTKHSQDGGIATVQLNQGTSGGQPPQSGH